MRNILMIGGICVALGLGGCISVPNSLTPKFYMLEVADKDQLGKDMRRSSASLVGSGPIKIPEYQRRPQMVTQDQDKMLTFAQFDRWGESLDVGIARVIREDLTTIIPKTTFMVYPFNSTISVKYQVVVEIIQLESQLDKDLLFVAQWQIIDLQNSKTVLIKRSEFRQPITLPNYSGLAKTLSTACTLLSKDIAKELAVIPQYN